jgi:glycosyltransferase involved in cell wall biosynthesis
MNKLLTICIPTFNRAERVEQLLNEIVFSQLMNIVKVIVSDDGSSDDTYASLIAKKYRGDISVIRNKRNIGLAYNYIKLIESCNTDYFMVMADDDLLEERGVVKLVAFLHQVKPDFVSTAWSDCSSGEPSRAIEYNSLIKIKDIRSASNHSPGVVFKTLKAIENLEVMKERLEDDCYAATIFPIVVLALLVSFSSNNCWWYKEVVGGYRPSGAASSNLTDKDGDSWASLSGRWKEQKAFENVYKYMVNTVDNHKKEEVKRLLMMHKLHFYYRLEEGILFERPDLLEYFLMVSAVRVIRNPIRSIKRIVYYIVEKFKFEYYMK